MKLFSVLLVLLGLCLQNVSATYWYFLRWYAPATNVQFVKFSMNMVIPTLREAGTFYLWPGLQDRANTGVYQEVLDGRSGTWWIGAGWCCSNPSLPWGSGFNTANGGTVQISMTLSGSNWVSTLKDSSSSTTSTFPLGNKNFNQALLAIELTGVKWDFGQLIWRNVVMVMNTTSTAWCTNAPENYNGATIYSSTGGKAVVSGGQTTCTIDQIVMQGPVTPVA